MPGHQKARRYFPIRRENEQYFEFYPPRNFRGDFVVETNPSLNRKDSVYS